MRTQGLLFTTGSSRLTQNPTRTLQSLPLSHLILGSLQHLAFLMWILSIWAQVFVLTLQAPYLPSMLYVPHSNQGWKTEKKASFKKTYNVFTTSITRLMLTNWPVCAYIKEKLPRHKKVVTKSHLLEMKYKLSPEKQYHKGVTCYNSNAFYRELIKWTFKIYF